MWKMQGAQFLIIKKIPSSMNYPEVKTFNVLL